MDSIWPLFIAICGFLVFAWWRARTRIRRANRRRQRHAQRGEARAERLLKSSGYRILDRQVTAHWTLFVDGCPRTVRCRADLLVSKRNKRFIAEVKTGDFAPDPTLPATRRQLLEYQMAFPVDGVLLIDMVGNAIHRVSWE
jgi:hypothetical protein